MYTQTNRASILSINTVRHGKHNLTRFPGVGEHLHVMGIFKKVSRVFRQNPLVSCLKLIPFFPLHCRLILKSHSTDHHFSARAAHTYRRTLFLRSPSSVVTSKSSYRHRIPSFIGDILFCRRLNLCFSPLELG